MLSWHCHRFCHYLQFGSNHFGGEEQGTGHDDGHGNDRARSAVCDHFRAMVLGFFGMAAAIPLSYLMLAGMSEALSTDVYTIPSRVTSVFSYFPLGYCRSHLAGPRAAARKVHRLSLVQVLKSIE